MGEGLLMTRSGEAEENLYLASIMFSDKVIGDRGRG